MTEPRDQHDLLFRYLLGAISDTERLAVEEQVFASDSDINVLLQAEDELIDDYVRGALSASDRQLFESKFLCTNERRQRLERVESFVQILAQMHSETSAHSESVDRSIPLRGRGGSSRRVASSNQILLAPFTALLQWLDSDQERAAEKYEAIRNSLIRVFTARGFTDAEGLADETFDRVASRMGQLVGDYVGDPARYVLGVARAVVREAQRSKIPVPVPAEILETKDMSDRMSSCLESCLDQLSDTKRDLILQFYATEKRNKKAMHAELAQRFGISSKALRVLAYNTRRQLETCVRECLKKEE